MRGMVGRARMAGLVAGVLVTGLGACTGGQDEDKADQGRKTDKPVATACANGTFTWSHLTERERLTGVSDLERLGKGGGPLRNPMRRVYTPRPSVRADGPAPSPAEILFSLGKKAGAIDSTARTTDCAQRPGSSLARDVARRSC